MAFSLGKLEKLLLVSFWDVENSSSPSSVYVPRGKETPDSVLSDGIGEKWVYGNCRGALIKIGRL